MKIRYCFVSNSSTSSFIIISKKGELTEGKLLEMFKVPKDSLLYPIAEELASILYHNSTRISLKKLLELYFVKDIKDVPGFENTKEVPEGIIYEGNVATDEEGLEPGLVDMKFDYEDEYIIVKKEGGF